MNIETLLEEAQTLARGSYLDGFKTALNSVESLTIRIGEEQIDKQFLANKNLIVDMLKTQLKIYEKEL